jgi:hypothetical protein
VKVKGWRHRLALVGSVALPCLATVAPAQEAAGGVAELGRPEVLFVNTPRLRTR